MEKGKKPESKTGSKAEAKLWRLTMLRDRLNEYKQWFHPAPDEIEHLLVLMRDWAKLDGFELSENKLSELGGNSVFPPLIRFCQKELGQIAKFCESRRAAGSGTLQDFEIQSIQRLSQAPDLKSVNMLYSSVERIYVVGTLARAMQTSYRALTHPGTLTDLSISQLRGDILEVVAYTYCDIISLTHDSTLKGLKKGFDQVQATTEAVGENRKLPDQELERMKTRASELKAAHLDWKVCAIARELLKEFPNKARIKARKAELQSAHWSTSAIDQKINQEFPKVAFHTLRKYPWLKKLANP